MRSDESPASAGCSSSPNALPLRRVKLHVLRVAATVSGHRFRHHHQWLPDRPTTRLID
jgi:hypothetical protein